MSGVWTFVAQPQGDDFRRDRCLQQVHRRRVPEGMKRVAAVVERRSVERGLAQSITQLASRAGAGERLAEAIEQDGRFGGHGVGALKRRPLSRSRSGVALRYQ
jgi:hypothetical protein